MDRQSVGPHSLFVGTHSLVHTHALSLSLSLSLFPSHFPANADRSLRRAPPPLLFGTASSDAAAAAAAAAATVAGLSVRSAFSTTTNGEGRTEGKFDLDLFH
jgi:hypothetical protein